MDLKLLKRFWEKVAINNANGCWEWIGAFRPAGYGVIKYNRKYCSSHRLCWELYHGEVNSLSMYVCHKCDNPKCVNPNHLFLGTHSDNMKDAYNKGRLKVPITEGARFKIGSEPPNKAASNKLMSIALEFYKNHPENSLKRVALLFDIKYQAIRDARRKSMRSYNSIKNNES